MNCKKCKEDKMTDLTQGLGETRNFYCPVCGTHCYKGTWYTKVEWDNYVEEVS